MKSTSSNRAAKNPLPSDMLTIKELISFPGLEDLSDKDALDTITSLNQLGQLSFQVFIEEQKCKSPNTNKKEKDQKY
jgi:hypothetical protein